MEKWLDKINSPQDLKKLNIEQLKQLAEEIRDFIIEMVSRNGGHLASNLGVVDLTLAMHYVFDFENDRLLWDVGHQCYAHKIITGRRDKFSSLRKTEGVSGFPNPEESPYDVFSVGHAGTAIASAIGLALGKKHNNQDNKIVAIVGDASIVNGLSFEALNNLGLAKRQLLVVLNDNSMAIDPTVGAVAKYFAKVRLSHQYEDLRKSSKNILDHLPKIGKSLDEALERFKKSIRMVLPASQLFESLNIPYFGPVDGHDLPSLIELFKGMAHLDRPAILHIYTKKGKGYEPAETDGGKYHSTGPFKLQEENGDSFEPEQKNIPRPAFTEVFGRELVRIAQKDSRVVAITSAMCDGTGLREFREKFHDRFYDVGIAESAAIDIAGGLAKEGLKPFVCIYSTFLQRGFDQIFQEVSLQKLPVVFCIDRAGAVGADGPTHHGLMDIGFLRMMPNMVLIAPANEKEMGLALDFALESKNCVCLRYPKDMVPPDWYDVGTLSEPFELGKSVIVRPAGSGNVWIVNYGCLLGEAVKAADKLADLGLQAGVINARFASPIDNQIIDMAAKGAKILTLEDHYSACGFGSAVLEQAARKFGTKQIMIDIAGAETEYLRHDTRPKQLMHMSVSADKIVERIKLNLNGIWKK